MNNLIDLELPSEASALGVNEGQNHGLSDIFSPDPTSSRGVHQQPLLPEPMVPTKPSSLHQEAGDNESDATESADSENDMDAPSDGWEFRRSSSSSIHSGEDTDPETLERRQFMKAYVKKVFHGK